MSHRLSRTIDVVLLLWLLLWCAVGYTLGRTVNELSRLSDGVIGAGEGVSDAAGALDGLADVPLIGGGIRRSPIASTRSARARCRRARRARMHLQRLPADRPRGRARSDGPSARDLARDPRPRSRGNGGRSVARSTRTAAGSRATSPCGRRPASLRPHLAVTSDPWGDLRSGRHAALASMELTRLGLTDARAEAASRPRCPRPDARSSPAQRVEERPELPSVSSTSLRRLRAGHDAGPGEERRPFALERRAAQRDRPIAVAVGVDPSDGARVASAVERLELGDRRAARAPVGVPPPRASDGAPPRGRVRSQPDRRAFPRTASRGARRSPSARARARRRTRAPRRTPSSTSATAATTIACSSRFFVEPASASAFAQVLVRIARPRRGAGERRRADAIAIGATRGARGSRRPARPRAVGAANV